MRRPSRPRRTASLSDSVQQHLNLYALAASAAGVGALALGQSAEAKIIYTPAHQVIAERTSYHLDLNHDKTIDFTISNAIHCGDSGCGYSLILNPAKGNGGIGHRFRSAFFAVASALERGARIGPDAKFPEGVEDMAVGYNACSHAWCTLWGSWINAQRRFLGLRFKIKGQTHYGWARLNVEVTQYHIAAVLTGYAFETAPNKSIVAGATKGPDDAEPTASSTNTPRPATLGTLALGSPGLSIWRREESVSAAPEGGLTLQNR
jgi:hypothetical protein